ncbi:DUF3325 domain-containing protein [Janthinobacterium fluminis]|uniref:DUF3325 domain-containing protein n=1 Tax=Janthinobacterium fluminis TaxID=2987524 RepID=A0ABT5K2M8_9BURK|nr:DUF3325 domain-containing protein [Janthinobacterium fluminis]MDC8758710.1 DUF3325 domain-containing protein [Janthinobacterium fluminis]
MIIVWSALALSYAGMAGLCLAMDRHHGQVWGRDAAPPRRRGLRAGGALLLALSLWACVTAWSGSVGFVAWLGVLAAGALLVVGQLPYAPRLLPRSAALAGAAALAALAWRVAA